MACQAKYNQGGDAQAIQAVARRYYGGYARMFDVHGWSERGNAILPNVQRRIVETYGSVQSFEKLHLPSSDLIFPMEAITSEPPNVWLTSFYGFRPETWGFVGFTDNGRRSSFLRQTKAGVLVVIYASGEAPREMRGNVVGVLQCTHEIGHAERYCSPEEWIKKQADPTRRNKWNFAVRVARAWRATADSRIPIRDFAPVATATEAWQHIGALGDLLDRSEANNILRLELEETNVYLQQPIDTLEPRRALEVLAPSKAGPVSKVPFLIKEAEGPKHLYVLQLIGDEDAFLGEYANRGIIVKVGMSVNPHSRCATYNDTLPKGAYRWEVIHSGDLLKQKPYPTSDHALAGERAMKTHLRKTGNGRSLGKEFFLATPDNLTAAWLDGSRVANAYTKD